MEYARLASLASRLILMVSVFCNAIFLVLLAQIISQTSVCLSCYSGAIFNSTTSTCGLNTTCNSDSSCTDCGVGFNYILVGSTCMDCPTIENCIQCSTANTQNCKYCKQGLYPNTTGGCSACSSNCTACISSTICSSCVSGFTLPQDQTSGSCLACSSPCLTCIGASTSCSSCIDGFTKKGWKCLNNTYLGFTIVLNAEPAYVLNNIDSIINGLLEMAQKTNGSITQGSITFTGFKQGSTVA